MGSAYRKKPVIVHAWQWRGDRRIIALLRQLGCNVTMELNTDAQSLIITTLEGDMRANPGDWIIRGVKGEFYPCKPDIFAQTYEITDETAEPQDSIVEPIAELIEVLQSHAGVGLLGSGLHAYTKVRDRLNILGWTNRQEIAQSIRKLLNKGS